MKIQELEAVTSWQSSQYPAGRKIKKLGGQVAGLPRVLVVGDIQWPLR